MRKVVLVMLLMVCCGCFNLEPAAAGVLDDNEVVLRTVPPDSDQPVLVGLEIYGYENVPEPDSFKRDKLNRYKVRLESNEYPLNLAALMHLVNDIQYPQGRWSGKRVTRIVFD